MKREFKIDDLVLHRTREEFEMIIIDFEKRWENDMSKNYTVPNPKYPICRYYNKYTNKWEVQSFNDFELELVIEDEK